VFAKEFSLHFWTSLLDVKETAAGKVMKMMMKNEWL
jgi:hypothetical protein